MFKEIHFDNRHQIYCSSNKPGIVSKVVKTMLI